MKSRDLGGGGESGGGGASGYWWDDAELPVEEETFNPWDLVKLRGVNGERPPLLDPGLFELFIPSGLVSSSATTFAGTPISTDSDLADGIWEGQNAKIRSESAYCDQLQAQFDQKQSRLNAVAEKLIDIFQEVIGEILGTIVQTAVTGTYGPVAGWFAAIATELGIEWGINALIALLVRGNELLEGIKDENDKILDIEQSRENYDYRERILSRHREDIKIILEQIREAEKGVDIKAALEAKEIRERLTDLTFQDTVLDMGDSKLNVRGKVVTF